MFDFAKKMKFKFIGICKNVANNISDYSKIPNKDFSRKRVLTPLTVLMTVFNFGNQSLTKELLNNKLVISRQSLSGALKKINISAFVDIFKKSLDVQTKIRTIHGYQVAGVDGTYFSFKENDKKSKQLLCVMVYDLLNHYYLDCNMSFTVLSEISNFLEMLKNLINPIIFVFDRGYSSINLIAHLILNNKLFVIRTKDIKSNGILKKCKFKNMSFDTKYTFRLTRNQSLKYKQMQGYRFLSSNSKFDFIDVNDKTSVYEITLRIVRFRLPSGNYETLLTNLPKFFTVDDLMRIYHLRWEIETSFRDLKHTLNGLYFHTKNQENMIKEIYAKLTIYNYTKLITNYNDYQQELITLFNEYKRKYIYKTNFSNAVSVVKNLFFYDITEELFVHIINIDKVPIRENRKRDSSIFIKSVPVRSWNYRAA